MDSRSRALFRTLLADLDIRVDAMDNPFDPFPYGRPAASEVGCSDFRKHSLICSAFKKFKDEIDAGAGAVAIDNFLQANKACEEYVYPTDVSDPALGYALTYSRLYLRDWLEPTCRRYLNPSAIRQAARFGPGASQGKRTLGTNLYFKVGVGQLTFSNPQLYEDFVEDCSWNPTCHMAEEARHKIAGEQLIEYGRLETVRKSYYTDRTILIEPSLNTYYQLGAGEVLEEALRSYTGIDFRVQPERNARLACQGSLDGMYATVDLKQCSDYQSLAMIRAHCPKSLVRTVERYRTPYAAVSGDKVVPLWMVSTMGNGFTFPLQTIILTSVVLGVYKTLDLPIRRPSLVCDGNYGVFGDDIVCLTEAYPLLLKCLTALGYVVNEGKSYAAGPFRESCGSDWYEGVNVRGVYIRTLKTEQDLFSAVNRLAAWSATSGITLPRTLALLMSWLRRPIPFIPPDCQDTSGIKVAYPPQGSRLDRNGAVKYVYHRPLPRLLDHNPAPGKMKKFITSLTDLRVPLNENALLKCALGGHMRSGRFSVRSRSTRYVISSDCSPNWGFVASGPLAAMSEAAKGRWIALTTWMEIRASP